MVIGIIALLLSIVIPTMSRARESAARVQCASNLRQVGMVESMYANENHGWLLLREGAHAGTVNTLVPPSGSYFSINLSKYSSPQIWFCPQFYRAQWGRAVWNDGDRKLSASIHRMGYGFYSAYWTGSAPAVSGPNWGMLTKYTNLKASKTKDLRPTTVRASEYYLDTVQWGMGSSGRWHQDRRGRLAGGNILWGDGSVSWSAQLIRYQGGEVYAVPEGATFP